MACRRKKCHRWTTTGADHPHLLARPNGFLQSSEHHPQRQSLDHEIVQPLEQQPGEDQRPCEAAPCCTLLRGHAQALTNLQHLIPLLTWLSKASSSRLATVGSMSASSK